MFSSRVRRIIQPFRPRFLLKSRAKVIGTPCSRSYSALTESFVKGELEPPLLEETIYANFADKVQRFGDRPCVVSRHQGDEGRLTYSALDDAAARLASGFLELGLKPGDRVAMWSFNNWEWIAMQIATARVGLVLVNLSPAYTAPELRHALSLTGCKAVVTQVGSSSATGADHQFMDVIREVIPEIDGVGPGGTVQSASFPELEFIIGTASTDNVPLTNGVTPFQDLMTADPTSPALIAASEGLHIDDAINIQFTSGTTGLAKGTTLTHRNILNNGNQIGSRMGLTPNDSVCVPVPMFHCFGLVLGSLAALTHGSSVVFPAETFDPLATLQVVHDERCTALHGVPTMFLAELNHPRFKEFDLSSLRTGIMAGTLCPVDVMRRVVSDMNITEMTVCYGMTETSPVTFQTKRSDGIGPRTSSIGTVHPHVEAKIVAAASEEDDDSDINSDAPPDGTPLPVGEAGELWTRGYVVMKGYWNEPDKTEEAIVDGWMRTGDLAVLDEHGYCRIVGRSKDVIIRGGENIFPKEVEECLREHPDFEDVEVVGVPDEKYGEEVCAVIRLASTVSTTPDVHEIAEYCAGRMAKYKIPRYIAVLGSPGTVDDFPMTLSGKVQKYKLRRMAQEAVKNTAQQELVDVDGPSRGLSLQDRFPPVSN